MASLLPLDKAAASVGKSEVTIRRLIKAGKIPFEKEKTLTGFIYVVDPEKLRAYYKMRNGALFEELNKDESYEPAAGFASSSQSARPIRVAVASESGSAADYWQKKSELYEDKYLSEVTNHAQTREDLGVWRGRAEQAQAMLMKMLPAPAEAGHDVSKTATPSSDEGISWATVIVMLGSIILVVAVAGVIIYLKTR